MSLGFSNIFLCSSLLLIPLLVWSLKNLDRWTSNTTKTLVVRNWMAFIIFVFALRAIVGALSISGIFNHWSVGKFYPIRIAFPNYDIIVGLPYVAITILILIFMRHIGQYILSRPSRYFLLLILAMVLSILFGAMHGGIITGNIGIANDEHHLYDASLNPTTSQIFTTHANRVAEKLKPFYLAAHTLSHPSFSLAYWQIMLYKFPPYIFSLVNVFIFSLSFPIVYWSLARSCSNTQAFQATLVCMLTPALLIYGRADDVIYYSLAAIIMALSHVAIREKRYDLTFLIGILFALAMNFSYASLILLPALLLFNASEPLAKCWQYLRLAIPHVFLIITIVICIIAYMQHLLGYNYITEFLACAKHSASNNIVNMLHNRIYGQILNARVMSVCDILLFGGPFFLYVLYILIKGINLKFVSWPIKNIALTICLVVLMLNSNGPGEQARPWGSLYLLIGIPWFSTLLQQETENTTWWIIRIQLIWALALQVPLNFGW